MIISTGAREIRWSRGPTHRTCLSGDSEVDRDGGERGRAEGYDEDRDQSTKGRFCFDFEDEFHDRTRASRATREVSRARVKGGIRCGWKGVQEQSILGGSVFRTRRRAHDLQVIGKVSSRVEIRFLSSKRGK
mgnify:CR=1 FL=1